MLIELMQGVKLSDRVDRLGSSLHPSDSYIVAYARDYLDACTLFIEG